MRINILSVFLLLIIYSIPVHAQFDSVRSTLSISFGTAIPQYQYAMAKDNNEKAGYAKTGMSFNTEFIYHFYNYFGVCMNYSSGSNNPDETLLHDDMQDRAI